jgi:hypothetical protein
MRHTALTLTTIAALLALVLGAGPAASAAAVSGTTVAGSGVAASVTMPEHLWVGFYVATAPGNMTPLTTLESKVGLHAAFSNYFQYPGEQGFTGKEASSAIAHGTMPLITLEMWDFKVKSVIQPAWRLKSITAGAHDAYLRKFAQDAKAFGRTVWLRPLHEMNGNWYPWGGTVNGNAPADFVPAWRHIRDIFTQEGATNVKFVWCPNVESIPITSANAISKYWPGDAYVDYMALDGYNFGVGDGGWRSFSALFTKPYNELTGLSQKPLFIAETGCATVGGDKAAWVADMLRVVPAQFPRIRGIGWFNENGARDWRIDSPAASLAAFQAGTLVTAWSGRSATTLTVTSRRLDYVAGSRIAVSGALRGGAPSSRLRVYVRPSTKSLWTTAVARMSASGVWAYRCAFRSRGTYYVRAAFDGDAMRLPSASRIVTITIR